MIVKISTSSLRNGTANDYLIRFVLGGGATVFAGWISSRFGASIGGLFLALPAIFCASASLIEKHEARRKHKAGLHGRRRGQQAAALDAAGTALGSIGMLVFAGTFSLLVERSTILAFVTALVAWCAVSVVAWWTWRHFRVSRRAGASQPEPSGTHAR